MPPSNLPHLNAETSSPSGPHHQPQLHPVFQTPSVGGPYDERGHGMRGPEELPMSFGKTGRGSHHGRGQGSGQQLGLPQCGGGGGGGGRGWNGGRGDFGRGRGRSFPLNKGDERQGGGGFMGRWVVGVLTGRGQEDSAKSYHIPDVSSSYFIYL